MRALVALVALGLALGATGCACELGPRVNLLVDLQTDLVPGYDFRTVRVRARDQESMRPVRVGDDFVEAARVAELRLPPGTTSITGELLAADGQVLVARTLLADLRTDTSVRLVISASCVGVSCPLPDETCIAGACGASDCGGNACRLDDLTICPGGLCSPTERCEVGADCTPLDDGCSTPRCVDLACLHTPLPGSCASPNYCRPGEGCREPPDDLDAGPLRDGATELRDGDLPGFDAGVETCVVCTTICGSSGLGVCEDGVPTGECLTPPEACGGADEDCDGSLDEGLDCDHAHDVICDVTALNAMEEPETRLLDTVTGGPEPGTVCGSGFCVSVLERCRTLPGADGHVHRALINGDDDVVFSPLGTELAPGSTSLAAGHTHQVRCAMFDETPAEPTTATVFHDLQPAHAGDPLRYNRFCESLEDEPPSVCFSNWGACEAR